MYIMRVVLEFGLISLADAREISSNKARSRFANPI